VSVFFKEHSVCCELAGHHWTHVLAVLRHRVAYAVCVRCQVETLAVADIDVEGVHKIPLWIIIISTIAGLVLLAIVILLLWKVTNTD